MLLCREIMTPNPAHCRTEDRVSEVAEIMRDRDVGAVPVVRDGILVGLVTDRDLVVRVIGAGLDPARTRVEDAMTRSPMTARPNDRLDRTVERMERQRVRRVPVVDPQGRLVGIVTQSDVAARSNAPLMVADLVGGIARPPAISATTA